MFQKSVSVFYNIINRCLSPRTQKYCNPFVSNFMLISALLLSIALKAQPKGDGSMDAEITKELTISGFCLCKTSVAELQGQERRGRGGMRAEGAEELEIHASRFADFRHHLVTPIFYFLQLVIIWHVYHPL